jgi:hypothetical protein
VPVVTVTSSGRSLQYVFLRPDTRESHGTSASWDGAVHVPTFCRISYSNGADACRAAAKDRELH